MKTIKDSSGINFFSNPFYVEEDSSFMHVLCNSGIDPYIVCGPLNGSIYYIKINKQNGNISSTCRLGSGMTMRGVSAKRIKGSIYISSTMSSPFYLELAMIQKFNINSLTSLWSKMLQVYLTSPSYLDLCVLSNFQTNASADKLYFFASKSYSNQSIGQSSTFVKGGIDTNGNYLNVVQGVLSNFTVSNAPIATYYNFDFIHNLPSNRINFFGQNYFSKRIALFSAASQTLSNFYVGKELNLKSDGHNFCSKIGNKIVYFFTDSTGTNCLLTDTLNNLLQIKKISNLFCRALSANKNSVILTLINSLNGTYGDHLYNIQFDTILNPIMKRKMFLDTFRVSKFNCVSFMDSVHFTNVFNFPINLSKNVFINRQTFNTLACNEMTFTPQISTITINNTNALISVAGNAAAVNYTTTIYSKGFKDSTYCFFGDTPDPITNITSNSVCIGGISNLSTTCMGTLNTILWNFQNANFNSSSVLSPSVIYNSSGLHTATLTVTNIYGSITRTTNIRVWPSPTISINNSSVCLGQSLTLQPSGAFTYTFQGNSSVVSPSTSTSYSIIGTSSNGCVCSYPASVQITVWQVPNISVAPNKSLVCIGESYSLVASGCNTYTWNSGAQGNQANFIAQQQAVNTVSCTDINGCMTSTQFKIITSFCSGYLSNGIVNHENEFDVTISNGVMHLTSTYSKVVKIELYDSGGKLVYKRQIDGDFHEIDLNEFSKGVYFLQLNSDNAFLRKKVCYCEE